MDPEANMSMHTEARSRDKNEAGFRGETRFVSINFDLLMSANPQWENVDFISFDLFAMVSLVESQLIDCNH